MGQLEIFDPKTPQKWRNNNFSAGIRRKYGFLAPISPTTPKMVKLERFDLKTSKKGGNQCSRTISVFADQFRPYYEKYAKKRLESTYVWGQSAMNFLSVNWCSRQDLPTPMSPKLDGMRQKTKIKAQKPTILFDFVCLLL
jgi:hypothetical protein